MNSNYPLPLPEVALLSDIEDYLQTIVAPLAADIDHDPNQLNLVLQGMADRDWLALRVPKNWGGSGLSTIAYHSFQQLVPRYSGALTFLQTQHQSAGNLLATSANESLKQQYLPQMGCGAVKIGVGFSHLRRRDNPPVKALPVETGYVLNGIVPWVTGFGFFQHFIVGATLPDGQALFGLVPFAEDVQPRAASGMGGQISLGNPLALGAMSATNTVTANFTDWFLSNEQVVCIRPAHALLENDRRQVLHHGFFALGAARAGLDILQQMAQRRQRPLLHQAVAELSEKVDRCQAAMFAITTGTNKLEDASYDDRLHLRAWAISLAGRCAQAAVIASSGAANQLHHPAQRVYREVLMFTVFGQTTDVLEATLALLLESEVADN